MLIIHWFSSPHPNGVYLKTCACVLLLVKLKVVVIDEKLTVIHQNNVQFDSELPEFR